MSCRPWPCTPNPLPASSRLPARLVSTAPLPPVLPSVVPLALPYRKYPALWCCDRRHPHPRVRCAYFGRGKACDTGWLSMCCCHFVNGWRRFVKK